VTNRTVDLAVDADAALVPVMRNVAADLAIRLDLQLDTIADLRLAVDEACGLLLSRAATPTTLRTRFVVGDGTITARVEVVSREGTGLPDEGFHWHVLTALVRSARCFHTRGPADEPLTVIELTVCDH
jgi:serine/threonine-protein kinase RsbW